jgi:ribosomal protein S18 acetylase RimI-like enzyme
VPSIRRHETHRGQAAKALSGQCVRVAARTVDVIDVHPLAAEDARWKREFLIAGWGATSVARRGELIDAEQLDGFVAVSRDTRVGLLTFDHQHPDLEIVTIQSVRGGLGIGRALMNAALRRAEELKVGRLWLTTTNNNFRAFAFYHLWGMHLVALYPNEVERSRAVKPAIPLVDAAGVPIRDELEFEVRLPQRTGASATPPPPP